MMLFRYQLSFMFWSAMVFLLRCYTSVHRAVRLGGFSHSWGSIMSTEPCLICGATPTDQHHWPLTRRYGQATVPLCREHHTAAHWARREVVEALIRLAPGYWRRVGEWEANAEVYETWCSRRRYIECLSR